MITQIYMNFNLSSKRTTQVSPSDKSSFLYHYPYKEVEYYYAKDMDIENAEKVSEMMNTYFYVENELVAT